MEKAANENLKIYEGGNKLILSSCSEIFLQVLLGRLLNLLLDFFFFFSLIFVKGCSSEANSQHLLQPRQGWVSEWSLDYTLKQEKKCC